VHLDYRLNSLPAKWPLSPEVVESLKPGEVKRCEVHVFLSLLEIADQAKHVVAAAVGGPQGGHPGDCSLGGVFMHNQKGKGFQRLSLQPTDTCEGDEELYWNFNETAYIHSKRLPAK